MGNLILGIVVGAVSGAAFMSGLMGNTYMEGAAAIKQCELTIPRDQHCIITAVIEESGE